MKKLILGWLIFLAAGYSFADIATHQMDIKNNSSHMIYVRGEGGTWEYKGNLADGKYTYINPGETATFNDLTQSSSDVTDLYFKIGFMVDSTTTGYYRLRLHSVADRLHLDDNYNLGDEMSDPDSKEEIKDDHYKIVVSDDKIELRDSDATTDYSYGSLNWKTQTKEPSMPSTCKDLLGTWEYKSGENMQLAGRCINNSGSLIFSQATCPSGSNLVNNNGQLSCANSSSGNLSSASAHIMSTSSKAQNNSKTAPKRGQSGILPW